MEERLAHDLNELDEAVDPPVPVPPLAPRAGTQAVQTWARQTQQATQGQSSTQMKRVKSDAVPDLKPKHKVWFKELAYGVADLAEALCWHAGDLDIWCVSTVTITEQSC